jgi:BirA family biotin operon repressor/biotin-[acetyl-CoA-carboxylase] ligase
MADIRSIAATGSTNDDVMALGRAGAAEALWLRADVQTGGRGRQGRAWIAPPGNLSASTLVRLRPGDPPAASLALLAGVALHEAASAWAQGAPLALKWPNDLLLDGVKLAGILLERSADAVVAGFGVNLAHAPDLPDRPATCLAAAGIAPPPADLFLDDLAASFARWLAVWRGEGLGAVLGRWRACAHPPGTALRVLLPDGETLEGLFDGLDEQGGLRLRLPGGGISEIQAADVFLI